MHTNDFILIAIIFISVVTSSGWLNRRFSNHTKYVNAVRSLLTAALFAVFFRKQIIDDVVHRKYLWLIVITFFFSYFIYTFFKDILKKEEQK